ncbi:MAG TPA: (2Fe-2S)-binding protein [Aggregatilineales bacterium]|nr:(2Fe-2S)-binding protein [Anaerolineae bacterium]HUN08533.1 (2Fe-2S)-binding protein [Aggregatilineales bacterium]
MELRINGQTYTVASDAAEPLLWVLRDELGLTGTKYGCGLGICGSCTVHVDGEAMRSCSTPLSTVEGKAITTIEGLATVEADGTETLHPVQEAFIEEQVPQCAWCMSGQMMQAAAFLSNNPQPTEDEIIAAMNNNYCRCGCYTRIKTAVALAAEIAEERRA